MISEQLSLKENLALLLIQRQKIIGRYHLKKQLNLTEGVTRGLLTKLLHKELIKTTGRKGVHITLKGQRALEHRLQELAIMNIKDVDVGNLKVSKESVVIHMKGLGLNISKGLEQRDAAIRAGAEGATTLIFKKDNLLLPFNTQSVEKMPQELTYSFKNHFKLRDNDVIVIGFATEKSRALEGALAAAIVTSTSPLSRINFKEKKTKKKSESEFAELTKKQLKEIQKLEKEHTLKLVAFK